MNIRNVISICCISAAIAAHAENQILYDFEDGNEGWTPEWGAKQNPISDTHFSKHGKSSLRVNHLFKKKDSCVGVRILFEVPKDVTTIPGFGGFSAWIYFPADDGWEAQLYLHTGDDWTWCNGKLYKDLQPGWHQIVIKPNEISNATQIRDIGIQIKNFKLSKESVFYVDRVEAIYIHAQ